MTGRLSGPRLALVIGILAAAAIIAFLLLRGGDDSGGDGGEPGSNAQATKSVQTTTNVHTTSNVNATGRPEAATLDQLRDLGNTVGHPVYWAGQQPGRHYELTVDPDGKVYLRYLAEGVPVGSRRVGSLTIGTYPYLDAFATLQAAARGSGGMTDRTPDDGLVVSFADRPNNVYIAFRDSDYEIEVYDPHPGRALELATAGAITQIR